MVPVADRSENPTLRVPLLDVASAAVLALLLALSWHLFTVNIDYSVGHHSDEVKKATFILTREQDFLHPVLMLQSARIANLFVGASTVETVLLLGRETVAAFAVALVLATYVLARLFVPAPAALAAAGITAVAPLTVTHAHYLKEDVHFSLFAILALAALVIMVRSPNRKMAILFGILGGLTVSSKYIGVLVFVLAYFLPRFAARDFDPVAFRAQTKPILLSGLAIFALVNFPGFLAPLSFAARIGAEVVHPIGGGDVKILPFEYLWSYHLLYSLWPGMTIWVLAPAVAAVMAMLIRWRSQPTSMRVILIAAVGYYLLVESAPMKTWPDFMRYVLPLVPLLALMLVFSLYRLALRLLPDTGYREPAAGGAIVLIAGMLSIPAYQLSERYNEALRLDTRDVAETILDRLPGPTIVERYTRNCTKDTCLSATIGELKQTLASYLPEMARELDKYDYAGIASFRYARILLSRTLWVHPQEHEVFAAVYESLLNHPRLQISSDLPPLGFIDPVIQIVDMKGDGTVLAPYRGTARDGQIRIEFISPSP